MISEIDVKEVRSTYHSFDVACEFAGNDRRVAVVYKITGPKKKNLLWMFRLSAIIQATRKVYYHRLENTGKQGILRKGR